jgi:23S rRNA pseudouridine2605 synthase
MAKFSPRSGKETHYNKKAQSPRTPRTEDGSEQPRERRDNDSRGSEKRPYKSSAPRKSGSDFRKPRPEGSSPDGPRSRPTRDDNRADRPARSSRFGEKSNDRPRSRPSKDDFSGRQSRPNRDEKFGSDRPERGPRKEFRSDDERPRRAPRAEGERFDRPERGPRKEFRADDERPRRAPRNEGDRSDRPERGPRKEFRTDDERPRRAPRAEGERSDRPERGPRKEFRSDDERPRRAPRAEGERSDRPERGPRKEFRSDDERPRRAPRAEGERSDRPERKGSFDREPRKNFRSDDESPRRAPRAEGEGTDGPERRSRFEGKSGDGPRSRDKKFGDSKPKGKNKNFDQEEFAEYSNPARPGKWESDAKTGPMTLNRYLAHAGVSSRRDAAAIIKEGKVQVNGEVHTSPGYRVQPDDKITMDGKVMEPQKHFVYVLLNKPKDFLTTTEDDRDRRTVMELVSGATDDRIYPVGRLDRNTTGVLLLTNDGDLAQKLSHPKYECKKIYQVTLNKDLTHKDFDKIAEGLTLEDGPIKVNRIAYLEKKSEIGVEIHSGRNRIVRRIFESLGYDVEKLDRVMYAGLTKKNVGRGRWRFLTEKEIINLKHFKS